jgi:hypothetical protein
VSTQTPAPRVLYAGGTPRVTVLQRVQLHGSEPRVEEVSSARTSALGIISNAAGSLSCCHLTWLTRAPAAGAGRYYAWLAAPQSCASARRCAPRASRRGGASTSPSAPARRGWDGRRWRSQSTTHRPCSRCWVTAREGAHAGACTVWRRRRAPAHRRAEPRTAHRRWRTIALRLRRSECAPLRRRWLDTTYLSARLRIGRSNAGATFVFAREDESAA